MRAGKSRCATTFVVGERSWVFRDAIIPFASMTTSVCLDMEILSRPTEARI